MTGFDATNTNYVISKFEGEVRIAEWDNRDAYATFDLTTGTKVRGPLDLAPETVLFLVWRQAQNPKFTDAQLRAQWAARSKQ